MTNAQQRAAFTCEERFLLPCRKRLGSHAGQTDMGLNLIEKFIVPWSKPAAHKFSQHESDIVFATVMLWI